MYLCTFLNAGASDDVTLAINGQPVLKQSGSGNVTLTPTYVLIAFSILYYINTILSLENAQSSKET